MSNPIDQLLSKSPSGRREMVRAQLRVAVTEALLEAMGSANLTKQQLAAKLGVSRSAVTQALATSRNLSLNTLADIAHAVGVRPEFHLSALEVMPPAPAVDIPLVVSQAAASLADLVFWNEPSAEGRAGRVLLNEGAGSSVRLETV